MISRGRIDANITNQAATASRGAEQNTGADQPIPPACSRKSRPNGARQADRPGRGLSAKKGVDRLAEKHLAQPRRRRPGRGTTIWSI